MNALFTDKKIDNAPHGSKSDEPTKIVIRVRGEKRE
jgi:hypothetical protein